MNVSPMALAYKGGKESDIILYKFLYLDPIVFHVVGTNEFPEITNHIKEVEINYNIKVHYFNTLHDAIMFVKAKCRTIIMGNKNTDIGWENKEMYFDMGPKYPYMTTYNPLYDWDYQRVWEYIEREHIITCILYDRGYTCFATKLNTFPNYFLYNIDDKCYKHAKYSEANLERQGIIMDNLPLMFISYLKDNKLKEHTNVMDGIYYGYINDQLTLIKIKKKIIHIKYKNNKQVTLTINGFVHRGDKINHKDNVIIQNL